MHKGQTSPSATSILHLVKSYLIGAVSYALPLWTPTKRQVQQLQTLIVSPLRKALMLPKSCSVEAICAEFDLPHITLLRESLMIRFAHRLSNPTNQHLTASKFRWSYLQQDIQNWPVCQIPMHIQLKEIESRWNLLHGDNNLSDKIKPRITQMTFENFKSKPNSHIIFLQFIRQRPGIPAYLKEEGRFYASIRARLRFGIGNDYPKGQQVDFVLSRFTPAEFDALPALMDKAIEMIFGFCTMGPERTMSSFNQ